MLSELYANHFFYVSNDENIETETLDIYITTTGSGKQP
jgi:hypothetical protein